MFQSLCLSVINLTDKFQKNKLQKLPDNFQQCLFTVNKLKRLNICLNLTAFI